MGTSQQNPPNVPAGIHWGSTHKVHLGWGGDPKVILLVSFVDWVKKNCDAHTDEQMDRRTYGQTNVSVEIVIQMCPQSINHALHRYI